MLVERARSVPLAQIAKEAGIDRACLSLFRYRQRGLSNENIEKLRVYFGLCLQLVPSGEFVPSPSSGLRVIHRLKGKQ